MQLAGRHPVSLTSLIRARRSGRAVVAGAWARRWRGGGFRSRFRGRVRRAPAGAATRTSASAGDGTSGRAACDARRLLRAFAHCRRFPVVGRRPQTRASRPFTAAASPTRLGRPTEPKRRRFSVVCACTFTATRPAPSALVVASTSPGRRLGSKCSRAPETGGTTRHVVAAPVSTLAPTTDIGDRVGFPWPRPVVARRWSRTTARDRARVVRSRSQWPW